MLLPPSRNPFLISCFFLTHDMIRSEDLMATLGVFTEGGEFSFVVLDQVVVL